MVGLKAISLLFPLSFPQIRNLAPSISTATLLSFAALGASYHILAPQYSTQKQLSWILTTVSSAVMTIMSLPFVYDYFMHGGRVQYIRTLSTFSIAAVRFFQGYLAADLTIGTVYYRDQLSTLTGWIHHLVYILVVELAVRRSWTHIFCLAAIMEIPTFILGITSLYPHLRSNILFALAFFSTRILFHLVLIVSFLLPESRMQTVGGSYVPAAVLAMIFPLHAMWFSGCIKGFYKRAHKKVEIVPSVIALDIYSDDVSTGVPSTPKDSRQTHSAIIPIARRRQSYENEAREREGSTGLVLVGGYVSLPGRETVFDFVGLGRGSKQDQ